MDHRLLSTMKSGLEKVSRQREQPEDLIIDTDKKIKIQCLEDCAFIRFYDLSILQSMFF